MGHDKHCSSWSAPLQCGCIWDVVLAMQLWTACLESLRSLFSLPLRLASLLRTSPLLSLNIHSRRLPLLFYPYLTVSIKPCPPSLLNLISFILYVARNVLQNIHLILYLKSVSGGRHVEANHAEKHFGQLDLHEGGHAWSLGAYTAS